MKTHHLRLAVLVPALAATTLIPLRLAASEATARAEAAVSDAKGDAAKVALDELNAEIDRVDQMLDNAPTPEERAAAKARLDVLKERRNDLRKTWATARYDQLKADVRAEANRVSAWAKRTFNRDEASNARRDIDNTVADAKDAAKHAGDSAYATAHSTAAAMDLAAYKMRPTDTNKAEAKAALEALEAKIEELDDRANQMAKGPDRDAAKRRVEALEDRKDKLQHEFNKARFNALVDDVQREWNDLIH